MTDKLREAAQAAYKAMIAAELSDGSKREWDAAVDGLKDALAEPAINESLTVQRPWVGLTDDEIKEIANNCRWSETYHIDFSRAIEALLKEKNSEHI